MVVEREKESVERGMSRPKTIDGSGPDKSLGSGDFFVLELRSERQDGFWVKATRGRGRS